MSLSSSFFFFLFFFLCLKYNLGDDSDFEKVGGCEKSMGPLTLSEDALGRGDT
jgi:hypothetical protein